MPKLKCSISEVLWLSLTTYLVLMSSLPRLDGVELALIVAEAGLYGIFIVLSARALEALYERRVRGESCALLFSVCICLFCTITAHLILDVARAFDAFIFLKNAVSAQAAISEPGASPATVFFEDLSNTKYVVSSCFYVVTTCVGDAFMIYRLYVVWSNNIWIIILPTVMQLGLSATGGVIQWLVAAKAHGSIFQTVGGWITAWFVLTFCTNLYSTVLIAYKVWLSKRSVSRYGFSRNSPVQRVVNALIQSAALYSLCLLLSLALYVRQNNVQYILAATNCPVVGIVFTMIAARTGRAAHSTENETESRRTLRDGIPMRPVTIKITTSTEVNSESATDNLTSKDPTFEHNDGHDIVPDSPSYAKQSVYA